VRLTHLGTATLLIEIGEIRLLTDPVFEPAGTKHDFGFGFASTKEYETAASAGAFAGVDAVLLSHDQHGDNLDARGREVMARAPRILTTPAAARRLRRSRSVSSSTVEGLAPFESTELVKGTTKLRITSTPARHGPPLSLPFVGAVTGFILEWEGQARGSVYITGDTVFYGGVEEVAARFEVGVAVVHLGCASWGPMRFTMNAREAATFARTFPRATLVPVHYDGWSHFKEKRADVERELASAGAGERLVWLDAGVARDVAC
jgi:L-ascorbate metabolism protein UlaG (beta-lactamase superfamily)